MENTVTVDRMWRSKINGNFIWGADQQTKVAPTKFENSIEGVGFRMLKQIGRRAVFEVATYLELQDVRWPVTLDNPLVVRVNDTRTTSKAWQKGRCFTTWWQPFAS